MAIVIKNIGIQEATFVRVLGRTLIICGFIWASFQSNGLAQSNILDQLGLNAILSGKTQEQEENRALLEDEAEQGDVEAQTDLSIELYKEGIIDEAKQWATNTSSRN